MLLNVLCSIETSNYNSSSLLSGPVMLRQEDNNQQRASVTASGSLHQDAVLNTPIVPTLVTMDTHMVGSSTNTTAGNATAGSSTKVVYTSMTPVVSYDIDTNQVCYTLPSDHSRYISM